MSSFSRLAAEVLSPFLGGIETKVPDDLVSTSVKENQKSITKHRLDNKKKTIVKKGLMARR